MEKISKAQARRLAVSSTLHGAGKGRGKAATLQTVRQLGYVQIDTISVIERAHHHVFWSRQPGYKQEYIDQLLAEDRSVFEHWAHAMSYLPMEDYRYYLPKIERFRNPPSNKWQKERHATAKPLFKSVLKRISEEGPLASKDFGHVKKRSSEGWWDWKPAKVALEYLYLRGELMVSSRKSFQRVYDLTERVLPEGLDTRKPTSDECAEFQIRRALQSMGLATEAEIVKYLDIGGRKVIHTSLRKLVESGDIAEIAVTGVDSESYYAFPEAIDNLKKLRTKRSVYLLSPFDNLVIQRERMRRLFDFDYTIECYVPAPKRKYGYFVCPVLWGDELVARIDMKANRKAGTLNVIKLHYEAGFRKRQDFDKALRKALEEFAMFNKCPTIIDK